jgi:Protein of unknown function (DUF3761)
MMLRRAAFAVAAAIAIGTSWAASPAYAVMQCSKGFYKAASGDCVHRPVCTPAPPPDATAECADGCFTFSEDPTDDDTCHGRGGVKRVF